MTCACGGPIREGYPDGSSVLQRVCLVCGRSPDYTASTVVDPSSSLPRAVPMPAAPRQSEKDVQQSIVDTLRENGYEVWETSEKRKARPCPKCGEWSTPSGGRPGISLALTDLFIRNPRWPEWVWIAMEVKGEDGTVRKDQHKAAVQGLSVVVWDLREALEAVTSADRAILGGNRHGESCD